MDCSQLKVGDLVCRVYGKKRKLFIVERRTPKLIWLSHSRFYDLSGFPYSTMAQGHLEMPTAEEISEYYRLGEQYHREREEKETKETRDREDLSIELSSLMPINGWVTTDDLAVTFRIIIAELSEEQVREIAKKLQGG